MDMHETLIKTQNAVFLSNTIFFISGVILLCCGIWDLSDHSSFHRVIGHGDHFESLKVESYFFSGMGILMMPLGILGCLGSIKENRRLLGFYFAFLLVLFAAKITLGMFLFAPSSLNIMEGVVKNYGIHTNPTHLEDVLDYAQKEMKCCGWFAPEDWKKNPIIYKNTTTNIYPCSCQNVSASVHNINGPANVTEVSRSGFCTTTSRKRWPVYQTGCMSSIPNSISSLYVLFAMWEIMLMIASMMLRRQLKTSYKYQKLPHYSE